MAGGSEPGARSLEETPTWAVATVFFVLVLVSIIIEHLIHLLGKWFTKRHKRALFEALEKIKAELMLLGFISLLLTVGQGPISKICVPESVADTWHPCPRLDEDPMESISLGQQETSSDVHDNCGRKLLDSPDAVPIFRRFLAGGGGVDACLAKARFSFSYLIYVWLSSFKLSITILLLGTTPTIKLDGRGDDVKSRNFTLSPSSLQRLVVEEKFKQSRALIRTMVRLSWISSGP